MRWLPGWFLQGWFGGGRREVLDETLWRDVCQGLPWLSSLEAARIERLRALSAKFLCDKTISPIGDLHLDDRDRVRLAALCCLPLIEFGAEGLHGWSELIVYPEAFRVRREHVDDDEVQHEWEDELIGEAWGAGPLILSWADVQADIASPWDGLCLPVHEMAHKLDALDGEMDGTPPLPREWQREWARDFEREYAAFVAKLDRDEDTAIDPYAAESPEEFFAVCSEYHFGAPDLLSETLPAVARHLRRFYGASPAPPSTERRRGLKAPAATSR